MKLSPLFGLLAFGMFVPAVSSAASKAECLDAVSKGQRFRDAHKLVEALEQLRVCAAAVCPTVVQVDCARWLGEIELALPTVVLAARSDSGADLVDVRVTVDGQLLVSSLDGHAVAINAGPHTFHFEAAGRDSADRQGIVREGEKNQLIAVTISSRAAMTEAAVSAAAPKAPAAVVPAAEPAPVRHAAPVAAIPSAARVPWRTAVGPVVGGVGVASLGLAAVFGAMAVSDKNGARCSSNVCGDSPTATKRMAFASDVALIVGGALVGAGGGLMLFGPHDGGAATASLQVMPVLTATFGGLTLGGVF